MSAGRRAEMIEELVLMGHLIPIGDDPTADPRVYRDTKHGTFRVADNLRGLWFSQWKTEEQALAVAEYHALWRQVDHNLKETSLASIDSSAAGLLAAAPHLAQAAAALYRAIDAMESAPRTGEDGPGAGVFYPTIEAVEGRSREKEATIEEVSERTRAAIVEYRAAWAGHSWEDRLDEGERDGIYARRRHASERLADALVDQAWRVQGWSAEKAAVLYRGAVYVRFGEDGDGVDQVLEIPLGSIIGLDEGAGAGEGEGHD